MNAFMKDEETTLFRCDWFCEKEKGNKTREAVIEM